MRPTDRQYMKSHEWCKNEDGTAIVGLSDHAVAHLSDLVFLDLPEIGASVAIGEQFGEIESVKAVSSLYSPVTGEVIDVNAELPDNLDWLSEDAYEKGWLIKVKVAEVSSDLLDAKAYEEHCQSDM